MADSDPDLSLASELCLACGLCCDGTLYPRAIIERDEVAATAALGLTTYEDPCGEVGFRLPCHYLDRTCCTRYDQWRPSVCSGFFCEVQLNAKQGKLTREEALAIVRKARALRDSVAETQPPEQSMAQSVLRFSELEKNRPNLTANDAQFAVRMFILQRYLDEEFRPARKGKLTTSASTSSEQ